MVSHTHQGSYAHKLIQMGQVGRKSSQWSDMHKDGVDLERVRVGANVFKIHGRESSKNS